MLFPPKTNKMAVIKMDWQKNILIAAILAVLFMLAIRWNTYQEQHAPGVAATTTASQAPAAINDVPTAPAVASNPVPTTEITAAAPTTVVQVVTDSLIVEINPVGGDIVKAALPRHSADIKTPDVPFVLINNDANQTYIAQSGIIGPNATDTAQGRPTFSVEKTSYSLENGQDTLTVDLVLQQNQVKITKRFTFKRGEYLIGIEYLVDNQSDTKWVGNLYGQIKRDSKNMNPKTTGIGLSPYLGGAIHTKEANYKKVTFDDLKKGNFEATETGSWVSLVQHYFISAWIPDANKSNTFNLAKLPDRDMYIFRFTSSAVEVAPNSQGSLKASFYVGPKDTDVLEKISSSLDLTSDYGPLWMISKPLLVLLKFIHKYVANWGISIILLTLCVKLIFLYPSAISYRSMAKMRKLAPKMAEMKERYGDDRQKMSQEMMKLYQTEKVNPLGGCLPMLIQMPVFLALYWVLMESVELRHAPFFLWINDLSVMDPFFVLPIIYGITMWFMQKLNPQPTDPMQARVMQMLPLVFTFMFLWFPAGLVLYWVTNNTLTIIQQYIITKQIENADKA